MRTGRRRVHGAAVSADRSTGHDDHDRDEPGHHRGVVDPVVLTLTARLGLRPLPFALLAVWLANTASLLLPVSNLTNLLALQREHLSTVHFATRMAAPEIIAVAVTVAYLGVVPSRPGRPLRGSRTRTTAGSIDLRNLRDRLSGVGARRLVRAPPWAAALPCAAAAAAVFALRAPNQLAWSLIPWRLLVLTEGLFLVVTTVARHGLTALLADLSGASVWRTTAVAAAASNLLNNLPAYLAVEPAVPVGHTTQLLGTLLGTNCGPLILLWGSLATLLWRERCKARGLEVHPGLFAAVGLGGVPLVLAATWALLTVTRF